MPKFYPRAGILLAAWILCTTSIASAEITATDSVNDFIARMVKRHGFQENALLQQFREVEIQQNILEAISKPAESKPWYQYRRIFLDPARISAGVAFWDANTTALKAITQRYGVPAEILIAILGVESRYGMQTGKYRVIDALATLGFAYPARSDFFLQELESFLLLSRTEQVDALQPMGSYAGAMGLPQFMPSSFLRFAVDFDRDGKRDIWQSPADALASVANYLTQHHWQTGKAVAFPVQAQGTAFRQALRKGIKPDSRVQHLRQLKISIPAALPGNLTVKLLSFQQAETEELWLALHNFYVITRYNHSPLYAMAVFQLSQAILSQHKTRTLTSVGPNEAN